MVTEANSQVKKQYKRFLHRENTVKNIAGRFSGQASCVAVKDWQKDPPSGLPVLFGTGLRLPPISLKEEVRAVRVR